MWTGIPKRFLVAACVFIVLAGAFQTDHDLTWQAVADAQKTVHVKGYRKKDGTYVEPYDRRAPSKNSEPASPPAPPTVTSHAILPFVALPTRRASNAALKIVFPSGRTTRTTSRSGTLHSAVVTFGTSRSARTGRIERSETAKRAFMRQTGFPIGRQGYVVDHIEPLACGGADSPSNMQWQTVADAKAKDAWERHGCRN